MKPALVTVPKNDMGGIFDGLGGGTRRVRETRLRDHHYVSNGGLLILDEPSPRRELRVGPRFGNPESVDRQPIVGTPRYIERPLEMGASLSLAMHILKTRLFSPDQRT
jgi:hypothetical protein